MWFWQMIVKCFTYKINRGVSISGMENKLLTKPLANYYKFQLKYKKTLVNEQK